jgi:hypothetical protein
MRKKDFKTTNQKFTVESGAGEEGTDALSYKYKKDTPGQSINGKNMKREKFVPSNITEEELEAFMAAVVEAGKKGETEFKFGNKVYEVTLDPVNPKAVKKKFVNRKDKDIDNDGDVDDSDEYLHKKRKAISKAVKNESEELDDIIAALVEASSTDYSKLSDDDLLDLLGIFKNVGRSAAKPVLKALQMELKKRNLKEEEELEEAKKVIAQVELWNGKKMKKSFKNQSAAENFIKKMQDQEDVRGYNMYAEGLEEANSRLVAHTPAAAQRLIKKLKNKFSGYKWDDMVKGNEIVYPNASHIKRFIKKQPEVADMKEEVSLEEAKRMKYDKVIKKLRDGEWDTSMDVKKRMHLTYTDNNTEKEKVVFVESDELEEASDKDLDIKSIKALIKKPSPEMIKQYGGKDKYIKMLKSKLAKLESTELEEAKAPFATLEKDWLRIKGIDTPRANKTRERLIKKYNLKPLISAVRPGSIKLGPLNDLKAKMGNHTIAGLDADGELIFVTNNPVKIYYPSNTKKRPEGEEMMSESASLEILRLHKVVELSLGESVENVDSFIAEANIELTMTPSSIQKAYKKYVIERKGVPTYEIYHKTYSDAMQSAKSFAKGSGYEVDEDDWHDQVSTGPRKPSKDKTNRFSILLTKNGKEQKKRLQIQVTNIGTSGRPFELNAYIA